MLGLLADFAQIGPVGLAAIGEALRQALEHTLRELRRCLAQRPFEGRPLDGLIALPLPLPGQRHAPLHHPCGLPALAGHPGEGAHRHRVEQFVGQHHAIDGIRPAGQPAHPRQRLGQLALETLALALRQFAGQFDDQVFGVGEAQPVQFAKHLNGQRA